MRNNLYRLLGSLDLLRDDVNCNKGSNKDLFQTALDCGEILFNMINNVLDACQISTQLLVPNKSNVEPRLLLHKIINICKANIQRKELKLELIIDAKLPKFLVMDPGRFYQVIMNLISNAIKFTEQGYIKIKVSWESDLSSISEPYLKSPPHVEYTENSIGGNYLIILPNGTMNNAYFPSEKQHCNTENGYLQHKEEKILCEY